jgi:small-conductance mechanosensitive channel
MNPVQPEKAPKTFWQRVKKAVIFWSLVSIAWYGIAAMFLFSESAREAFPLPVVAIVVIPLVLSPLAFLELILTPLFVELTSEKKQSDDGESRFRKRAREEREKRRQGTDHDEQR